ncbi:TIGR04255 family protein [Rhodopila sp.]|uniref:TIGR04255 family protein n=1 Tax=Rhodopila sp. TaxID=2480087 RepID=UPI003D0EE9F8
MPHAQTRRFTGGRFITASSSGEVMLLQHGIGKAQGSAHDGYVIDFDFAAERRMEIDDAESTLNQLHRGAGKAFRWCITNELHNALDPVSLDEDFSGERDRR